MKKGSIGCRCWMVMLICFVFSVFFSENIPSCVAAAVAAKGNIGEITWELDTNGILSFEGAGELVSYGSAEQVPWHAYCEEVKKVIFGMGNVPGGDISHYFSDCSNLQSVNNIPEGVQRMDEAFLGCKNLISIGRIPGTMESLCRAFKDCIRLNQEISIPEQAIEVSGAFDGCMALTHTPVIESERVTDMSEMFRNTAISAGPCIPQSVKDLSYTFMGCRALRSAPELPRSLVSMNHTFYGCSRMTTGSDIPANVNTMAYCFYGCSDLASAPVITSNVVENMEYAFYDCINMQTSPRVPENVRNMAYTFYNCGSMQSAPDVGPNVKKMSGCFAKCGKVSGTMTVYAVIHDKADYEKFAGETGKYVAKDNPNFLGGAGSGLKVNYINNNKSQILNYLATGWNSGALKNEGLIGNLHLGTMGSQNVASCEITKPEDVIYDGTAFTPEPVVYYAGIKLEKETDYILAYRNNKNAGTATVNIVGQGEYDGDISVCFTIQKAPLKSVKAYDYSGVYDGKAHSITVVCDDGAEIEYGEEEGQYTTEESPEYTLPGVYTVYFRVRKPNYETYTGSSTVVIESAKLNVDSVGFSGEYDGNPHSICVSADEGALIRYGTVSGKYNMTTSPSYINAGTYTVYYEVSKIGYATFTGKRLVIIRKRQIGTVDFPHAIAITKGDSLLRASLTYYSNKYGTFSWKDSGVIPEKSGFYPLVFMPLDIVNYGYEGVSGYRESEGVVIRDVWVDVNPDEAEIKSPGSVPADENNLSGSKRDEIHEGGRLTGEEIVSSNIREDSLASFIKNLDEKGNLNTIKGKTPERPGKTEIKKLHFTKRNIKVVWKKVKKAVGYQITCSRKKNGKGSTKRKDTKKKSAKIRWEKNGTCYIKVRAYTVYKGRKVYGAWSKVRSLKRNKPAMR